MWTCQDLGTTEEDPWLPIFPSPHCALMPIPQLPRPFPVCADSMGSVIVTAASTVGVWRSAGAAGCKARRPSLQAWGVGAAGGQEVRACGSGWKAKSRRAAPQTPSTATQEELKRGV